MSIATAIIAQNHLNGIIAGIGCAGEIRISRHEDFDKWAIDILVKFRDNERLQLLTAQRQSGGVRVEGLSSSETISDNLHRSAL